MYTLNYPNKKSYNNTTKKNKLYCATKPKRCELLIYKKKYALTTYMISNDNLLFQNFTWSLCRAAIRRRPAPSFRQVTPESATKIPKSLMKY